MAEQSMAELQKRNNGICQLSAMAPPPLLKKVRYPAAAQQKPLTHSTPGPSHHVYQPLISVCTQLAELNTMHSSQQISHETLYRRQRPLGLSRRRELKLPCVRIVWATRPRARWFFFFF